MNEERVSKTLTRSLVAAGLTAAFVLAGSATATAATTPKPTKVTKMAVSTTKVLVNETFTPTATVPLNKTFTDGNTFKLNTLWNVNFAGYGSVKLAQDAKTATTPATQYARLTPAVATADWDTHATLVTSASSYTQTCNIVSSKQRTAKQLRTGSPANPWEVSWLVWDYTDNDHFTYLAIKPNGWELGKRDPNYLYGQRFLATGETKTPIGQWRNLVVKRTSPTATTSVTTVKMDNVTLTTFTDRERAYHSGKVGMYTEDAVADWDMLKVETC